MLAVGITAPDFTLADRAGQARSLASALAQGPVILAFFKADCATCHLAFPYLERLRQTYRSDHWQVWGICQHPPRAADWFAKTNGITFPLLIDEPDFRVSHQFDPPATPTVFLLDRDGTVREMFYGFTKANLNALASHLAELIGEDSVIIAPPDDGKPAFRPG